MAGGDAGRLRNAVSPIRRPRAFARALGAMVAEQAGPRGRIVVLRSAVEGRSFSAAHKSQAVYHGPVVYEDDPVRRLERASSELELSLLLVFLKDAARRAQREYRFAVWAEDEPVEDALDLNVTPALVDAMRKPRPEPEGSGFVRAGAAEYSAVEELEGGGSSRARARVETLPAFFGAGNPTVVPRPHDAGTLPGDLRETAAVRAAVEALREAVDAADGADAGRTLRPRRGTRSRCCGSFARSSVARSPACESARTASSSSRPNCLLPARSRRASPSDRREPTRARLVPATRISRLRRQTCRPSSGFSGSAWRRSACRVRDSDP